MPSTVKGLPQKLKEVEQAIRSIVSKEDAGRLTLALLVREVQERVGDVNQRAGGVENLVKYAWNYEEKFCRQYSLEEAIKWFKMNRPRVAKAGCIFRRQREDVGVTLHHCFLDASNNPLLDGAHPHRAVHTPELCLDLEKQFGTKDLLVLR
jgi:hypothetical protein